MSQISLKRSYQRMTNRPRFPPPNKCLHPIFRPTHPNSHTTQPSHSFPLSRHPSNHLPKPQSKPEDKTLTSCPPPIPRHSFGADRAVASSGSKTSVNVNATDIESLPKTMKSKSKERPRPLRSERAERPHARNIIWHRLAAEAAGQLCRGVRGDKVGRH